MVKFILIFLSIFIVFASSVLVAGTYSGGSGTSADPYRISSTADLIELSLNNSDWFIKYYIQTQDIVFDENEQNVDWDGDGTATWDTEDQLGFSPIGRGINAFQSNYNGQGYAIKNLYINRMNLDQIGLFGHTWGATIKNVGVEDVDITGKGDVGALIGLARLYCVIENCYSSGSVRAYDDYSGGLIGVIDEITIKNCHTNTYIMSSGSYVGGFAGYAIRAEIIGCYSLQNVGSLEWEAYAGGFIGAVLGTTVSKCYSKGSVSAFGTYCGGFIGLITNYIVPLQNTQILSSIDQCFSTGSVFSWNSPTGGFVGELSNNSSITNCYSTGNVTRTSGTSFFYGGFCGISFVSYISSSYATGKVYESLGVIWDEAPNGKNMGFIGDAGFELGYFANNYFDSEASEQTSGLGASAKTTSEMKKQSTFTEWEFTEPDKVWSIDSREYLSYPYLYEFVYDNPNISNYMLPYDIPETTPEVNPIPGLYKVPCENTVYVDGSYDDEETSGFNTTHFSDITLALIRVCDGGTINLANESHTSYNGNLNFGNRNVVIGNFDFILTGNISSGLVRATNVGKLFINDLQENTSKSFPLTDGNNDFTITITTPSSSLPDIGVRMESKEETGSILSKFVEIYGPQNLDATLTMRIDKESIAPNTLGSTSNLRYFSSTKNRYVPFDGNNVTVEEFDTYYIITITGVNEF